MGEGQASTESTETAGEPKGAEESLRRATRKLLKSADTMSAAAASTMADVVVDEVYRQLGMFGRPFVEALALRLLAHSPSVKRGSTPSPDEAYGSFGEALASIDA